LSANISFTSHLMPPPASAPSLAVAISCFLLRTLFALNRGSSSDRTTSSICSLTSSQALVIQTS